MFNVRVVDQKDFQKKNALVESEKYKVIIVTEGLTDKENELVRQAGAHMESAINSEEFKKWCLNFSWEEEVLVSGRLWWKKYKKETRKYFHYNQNLTNFQIYNRIMESKEVIGDGEADYTGEIFLKVDRRYSRNVVGYTYANTKWQWIYSRILGEWGYKDVASNLFHELMHRLGFSHEYRYTDAREYSVPYATGYFVGKF